MNEREELLATVASLYYKLDQSQGQIANRLGVSASSVSRLLKEAKERGIVEIQIRTTVPRNFVLEQELLQRFGLKDAYVLQTSPDMDAANLLTAVGQLAVSYLARIIATLPAGSSIGVAWGTGVHAAVKALPDNLGQRVDVVQLMGGVGALMVDSPDLARIVATKLGGRHHDLHAPVLVEQATVRELFLAEPVVREGILRAKAVNLAITGIGSVQEQASSFLRAGLLSRADLANLRQQGAVGEMCGSFFHRDGSCAGIELNQRIIGIALEDLRRIPQVLAVACGLAKVNSILGALQGRYFTVLATDDTTARAVLKM